MEDAEVHPGRQHVDMVRLHGHMAVDPADRHPGRAGQNLGKRALLVRALMLDEDKGQPGPIGQQRQQAGECLEAARGRADAYDSRR